MGSSFVIGAERGFAWLQQVGERVDILRSKAGELATIPDYGVDWPPGVNLYVPKAAVAPPFLVQLPFSQGQVRSTLYNLT